MKCGQVWCGQVSVDILAGMSSTQRVPSIIFIPTFLMSSFIISTYVWYTVSALRMRPLACSQGGGSQGGVTGTGRGVRDGRTR